MRPRAVRLASTVTIRGALWILETRDDRGLDNDGEALCHIVEKK